MNLGTPAAPTTAAVRRYLREFLSDPRVVELPRWLWLPLLYLVILPLRPSRSAAAYRKIWSDAGSPLLVYSEALAAGLSTRLADRATGDVVVSLGMSYGEPSIAAALERLYAARVRRIVVLPLYPQYSGSTTGAVFDAVTRLLSRRRWVPALRFIDHYHDEAAYIRSVAESIREFWDTHGRGERLLFSFHGLPRRMLEKGDPYHCQCQKTARLVAETLGLPAEDWQVSFQSRLGRQEWLKPYTDRTLTSWGEQGMGTVDVVCPGFAVDCLETLEEIRLQNAEFFTAAGGGELHYIPALNAGTAHLDLLESLVLENFAGWPAQSAAETAEQRENSRRRAIAMGAER